MASARAESINSIFDEPLATLIWRVLVDAMGEVGRMDGHYLYDAQDNEEHPRAHAPSSTFAKLPTAVATIVYPSGDYKHYLEADFPEPEIRDERAEKAVCELDKDYKVTVPEGWDAESEAADFAEMFANGTG